MDPIDRDHSILMARILRVRHTAGGHPESPTPEAAIAELRELRAFLEAHVALERTDLLPLLEDAAPEAAAEVAEQHADLLARADGLGTDRPAFPNAHALAMAIRTHVRFVETEALPALAAAPRLAAEAPRQGRRTQAETKRSV